MYHSFASPLLRWHFCSNFLLALSFFLCYNLLSSCVLVRPYTADNQPEFYANNIAAGNSTRHDSLKIVSFNIKKAQKTALAAQELLQWQQSERVDICLLQEMDEQGVASLSRALGLNYLYIPSVYHLKLHKNIGNAILTTASIVHPRQLNLPHKKWLSKWRRNIAIGEMTIGGNPILVMSVHRETIMMSRKNRTGQLEAITEYARLQMPLYRYIIVGGDFNTLFAADGARVVKEFRDIGFEWTTANTGSTAHAFLGMVHPTLDYLFTYGLTLLHAGKLENSAASDHYPVFATCRFNKAL